MTATVSDLEAAGYALWSPDEEATIDGWTLRATSGFTRRINSATAVGRPSATDASRRRLHDWFAERSLPLVVRVTPLLDADVIDRIRAQWGLVQRDPTMVMTQPVRGSHSSMQAELVDPTDRTFLELVCALNSREPAHAARYGRIMSRLGPSATGVRIADDAVGFAAIEGRHAAVFSVAVAAERRRHGLATGIMAAASSWAADRGADEVFLQALAANEPAIALYRRLGFTVAYEYAYFQQDLG